MASPREKKDYLELVVGFYFLLTALLVFVQATPLSVEVYSASSAVLGLFLAYSWLKK